MEIEVNGDRLETNPVDVVRNQCRRLIEHIDRRQEESARLRKRLEAIDTEIARAMAERDRMLQWLDRNSPAVAAQNNAAAAQSSCGGESRPGELLPVGAIQGLGAKINGCPSGCAVIKARRNASEVVSCPACRYGPCQWDGA